MLRLTAFLVAIAWFATLCPADEKKVPLQTEFPREVLAGTPPNVLARLYPNLEPPLEKAPELLVPEGTKNVAVGKKVTSSESDPIIGKIDFVTDGNKEGSEDAYVELSPGLQWVQIDLEKPVQIYAIYVWHFFREARSYEDVIVQVADDEQFTKNVQTDLQQRYRRLGQAGDREGPSVHRDLPGKTDRCQRSHRTVRAFVQPPQHGQQLESLRGSGSLCQTRQLIDGD